MASQKQLLWLSHFVPVSDCTLDYTTVHKQIAVVCLEEEHSKAKAAGSYKQSATLSECPHHAPLMPRYFFGPCFHATFPRGAGTRVVAFCGRKRADLQWFTSISGTPSLANCLRHGTAPASTAASWESVQATRLHTACRVDQGTQTGLSNIQGQAIQVPGYRVKNNREYSSPASCLSATIFSPERRRRQQQQQQHHRQRHQRYRP